MHKRFPKAKNYDMKFGKEYVMNYKVTGLMATDFEMAFSYVKKNVWLLSGPPPLNYTL